MTQGTQALGILFYFINKRGRVVASSDTAHDATSVNGDAEYETITNILPSADIGTNSILRKSEDGVKNKVS